MEAGRADGAGRAAWKESKVRKGDGIIGMAMTQVLGQLAQYSKGEHESSGPEGAVTFMKDNFEMPADMLHDSILDLEKQGCLKNLNWPHDEPWATVEVTEKGIDMLAPMPGNG